MSHNNHQASSSTPGRRPPGRPLGSKNKPKMPIIENRDNPNALNSHVLEITSGSDVSQSLLDYARRQGRGINILCGNGIVTNVRLLQPIGNIIILQGNFEILSISGTVFPSETLSSAGRLIVYLMGTSGQAIGGSVMPPLMASGPVTLMAASFANTTPEKISSVTNDPIENEREHVTNRDTDLLNAGESTSEMINMMSSQTHYFSSSTQGRKFG
ncbi:AT-hook motif nuclear-localized protein 27-like [Lathyrus oleraceus]|uniref:AT-hook motif nuclear-localized protein 27-like n=1 Tax=Pisum sativum TaxID=3888 RepID=UPI001FC4C0A8|nr:AT-hook motif nuclear-localized protein 27-like [Pisum sativum]